jgi:hypothetical protein
MHEIPILRIEDGYLPSEVHANAAERNLRAGQEKGPWTFRNDYFQQAMIHATLAVYYQERGD